jgi:hypothetical protein
MINPSASAPAPRRMISLRSSLLDILIIPAGDDLTRDVRFGASPLID